MTIHDTTTDMPEEDVSTAIEQPKGSLTTVHKSSIHPIERDEAILPTRPLEEFVNVLREWLDCRLTGGVVWGNQRIGKTLAVSYVVANAHMLLGSPIPTAFFSAWDPKYTSLTENRFFGELLAALGYATPDSGTAAIKRRRLIDLIKDRVHTAGEYRFLLFIDEAQWLAMVQLRYLMDLHNQLKIGNIRLICILVGQPELMKIRTGLINTKQRHLLARFMCDTHQYVGVCSESDLARVVRAIDSQSEYPRGSGISYSAYYAPHAFAAGWRLEASVPQMWSILHRVMEAERLPCCNEFPIEALMAMIVWLLKRIAEEDQRDLNIAPALIEEGIYRCALPHILLHLGEIKAA